jgi:hypothetical protein
VNLSPADVIAKEGVVQFAVTSLVFRLQLVQFLDKNSGQLHPAWLQANDGAVFKISMLLGQLQYKPSDDKLGLTVVDEDSGFH